MQTVPVPLRPVHRSPSWWTGLFQIVSGAIMSAYKMQEITGVVTLPPKLQLAAFLFFLLSGGFIVYRKMREGSIVTGIQYFDRNNPVPSRPPGPA